MPQTKEDAVTARHTAARSRLAVLRLIAPLVADRRLVARKALDWAEETLAETRLSEGSGSAVAGAETALAQAGVTYGTVRQASEAFDSEIEAAECAVEDTRRALTGAPPLQRRHES